MNVLALVTDAFGSSGGIAQYNRDLAKALAGCPGANRIIILPRLGKIDSTALPTGVRQLKSRSNQVVYSLGAVGAAASLGPFDFIYCGHLYLAPLAALLAWFLGVPLWLQLHGWEAWKKPSWANRCAAERARLITAVSRYTRRKFLSLVGIEPSCVRVLPNTVEARFSPGPKPDRLLDRFGLRGKRILLTVGRLDPDERRKGHDRVIEALPEIRKSFADIVYLIVGQGDDRARLEALARKHGVEQIVLFTGSIEPQELPQLYRLADLFVMPSTQEGFGIVFLEAAACGVLLIGGNCDGSVDALADGAVGTSVDPTDRSALVRAIESGLNGRTPQSAGIARFAFENFANEVRSLVSRRLLRSAGPAQ